MTSYTLKMIAIIAMLIDHAAYFFGIDFTNLFFPDSYEASFSMLQIMRIIGRLTFPIIAYFIAEGCRKTSNINKYMLRMFIFGLLAQIPYTLAFNASNRLGSATAAVMQGQSGSYLTFISFDRLNVLFTLALGILAVLVFEKLKRKIFSYLLVIIIIVAAEMLGFEYGAVGVIAIFLAYALPSKWLQLLGMGVTFSYLYLSGNRIPVLFEIFNGGPPLSGNIMHIFLHVIGLWLGALTALLLIAFYNGNRGRGSKYMFYVFYPAHLIILVIIREIIRFM